jgi:hypothetical protein
MDTVLLLKNDFEMKKLSRVPATGAFFLVFRSAFFLLMSWSIATAQEFPKSAFGILNLVPRPMIIKISLGSNFLTPGDEEINPGFYSGMMPWRPEKATLKAEVNGYQTAELKPFLKATETPLIILQESSPHVLQLNVIPNSKERSPSFYDAINLTTKDNLEIQANKNSFSLPKNKRIRLSKEKRLSYALLGKQSEDLDPSDPGNFLFVLYTRDD